MGMQDLEIATTFGALDSTVAGDGTALHAHALRTLARTANRLYAMGGPVLNLQFDAYTLGTPETRYGTAVQVGGFPAWHRVYWPVPVAKSPAHSSYEARIRHNLDSGEEIWLQIATEAAPFDPNRPLDAANVLKLENDTPNMQSITGIPAPGRSSTDLIELWAYSARADNLASEATYGANNTGTVDGGTEYQIYDSTSTWTRSAVSSGRLVIAFYNGSIQVIGPRLVTGGGDDNLFVWPRLSTADWQVVAGATYEIHEMFQWELHGVAIYEEDLT